MRRCEGCNWLPVCIVTYRPRCMVVRRGQANVAMAVGLRRWTVVFSKGKCAERSNVLA